MLRLMAMLLVVGAVVTAIGSCATVRPTVGQAEAKARCRDGGLGSWFLAVDFWPGSGVSPEALCLDDPDAGFPADSGITFTAHCKANSVRITLSGEGINPDGGKLLQSHALSDNQYFTYYTHSGMVAGKTYAFTADACDGGERTGLNGTIEVASGGDNSRPGK